MSQEPTFMVMNPTGYQPPVQLKAMTERPESLDGKTIFFVDQTFNNSDVLLEELMKWFAANMPEVKREYRIKTGGYTTDDPALWREIQAANGLMIIAIGHCSTCAPAIVTHTHTVESQYNVPAVGLIVDSLKSLADDKANNLGMPNLRLTFLPTPVGGKSRAELTAYVHGNAPVTGKPLMQEIIGHLTRPLNEDEKRTGIWNPPRERLLGPFTQEQLQTYFDDRFWSDNLPIIAPTEERVAAMLAATSHKPDEQLGRYSAGSAAGWGYTVETAAINAVMAGAKPEHFPAILAIAATGGNPRGSSSSSMAAMAMFNGPIVEELLLNSGTGALQSIYNKSGAVMGRSWGLLAGNTVGGSVPGITYLGNQGNPMGSVPAVFAENEAGLPPGWKPLHVQQGFAANESVVSSFGGCQSMSMAQVFKDENWQFHLTRTVGGLGSPNQSSKLIMIDPAVAPTLVRFGFDTKEKLIDWVKTNVTMSKFNYWLDQDVINHKKGIAMSGREPFATWLGLPDDAQLPYLSNVQVVAVGGSANVRWSVNECGLGNSVRVDDWR